MTVTLSQIAPTLNRSANITLHIDAIQAQIGRSELIVFPELSLNGYMLQDAVYEDAFTLGELGVFADLSQNIDIALGCALEIEHQIYNVALYFSQGKIVHIHRKTHLPNYGMFEEGRYFFAGDRVESFESRFGKSVMMVCEDMWSASNLSRLSDLSPDTIFVLSASPTRGFENENLEIDEKWSAILKTAALFSKATIVFVNRVGFEEGIGFWGGSKVISADGKIAQMGSYFGEETLTFSLDASLSSLEKYLKRY